MRRRRFLTYILSAFLLNLVWEFSHATLYTCCADGAFSHAGMLIWAALGDVMYLAGIWVVGGLVFQGFGDLEQQKTKQLFLTAILGVGLAVFIEIKGLYLGKWAYAAAMPTLFGVGLSPLVQLAVTGMLALLASKALSRMKGRVVPWHNA